jgi:hypothetical protein
MPSPAADPVVLGTVGKLHARSVGLSGIAGPAGSTSAC